MAGIGANPILLWGLSAEERLRRIAQAQGMALARDAAVMVNLDYAFDPAWLRFIAARPDQILTLGGVPVLANVSGDRAAVRAAMERGAPVAAPGLSVTAWEESGGLTNDELRKRERPFLDRLAADTVRRLERASYFGAYKGVTDILTKYLWPEWALILTRVAARLGITPNMVTALGAILCFAAAFAFYFGWYWTGLALGLTFMVLDTVDGKLARCTITSSRWGHLFDHGIDLVHPPFWWWAWAIGLNFYGRPLPDGLFWLVIAVIVFGYVAQRLIEGAFIGLFRMHIHVWSRFDSRFRLITARRNPNMVILLACLIVGRPDLGLIAVAGWTLISLAIHLVRLGQALMLRMRGRPITSWLA